MYIVNTLSELALDIKNSLKWKLFIVISLGLCAFIYAFSLARYNFNVMVELQNVPVASVTFLDLRSLTSGLDCTHNGTDPMVANQCDVADRPFNYPRIWLGLATLGIGEKDTNVFGVIIVVCFYLSFALLLLKNLTLKTALFYLFLLLSPAALLAVERGNIDLIIFSLLVLAVGLLRRRNILDDRIAYVVILVAAILKVFPIFVIGALFFRETRKEMIYFVLGIMGIFLLYAGLTWNDIKLINTNTPHMWWWSYGYSAVFLVMKDNFTSYSSHLTVQKFLPYLTVVVAGLASLVMAIKQRSIELYTDAQASEYLDSFRIGASVFVGTFLLGTNFDYRLIFLLFCVPQLIVWMRKQQKAVSFSLVVLVLISLTMWSGFWLRGSTPVSNILEELVNWALWISLLTMLLLTVSPFWWTQLENITKRIYTRTRLSLK